MAKIIDITDRLKKIKHSRNVTESSKGEVKDLAELETEDDSYEYTACILCDKEFSSLDKIYVEKHALEDDPGHLISTYFHEKCYKLYLMDIHNELEVTDVQHDHKGSRNVCFMCEEVFDHSLSYTDGAVYYCDECASVFYKE